MFLQKHFENDIVKVLKEIVLCEAGFLKLLMRLESCAFGAYSDAL